MLKLANYKSDIIKLSEGTQVGFVIVNTFSLNPCIIKNEIEKYKSTF